MLLEEFGDVVPDVMLGTSLAVVEDGVVASTQAWGPRTTETTRFQAASISKIVAAIALVRLADEGRVDLDGAVADQVRSWVLPDPGCHRPTARQLLVHRGGVNVHGVPGYDPSASVPTLLECLEGRGGHEAVAVTEEPGPFRYSGGGYAVLQLLIEETTAEPFAETARRLVLDPLGMQDSGYETPTELVPGHLPDGTPLPGGYRVYPEQATAGLWTTPRDIAQLAIAVQRKELVTPARLEEMLGRVGARGMFGIVQGTPRQFWHPGANDGYRAMLFGYVDRPQGAAIMSATDAGAAVIDAALARIAETHGWPAFIAPE